MRSLRRWHLVGGSPLLLLVVSVAWLVPAQDVSARRTPTPGEETRQVLEMFEFTGRRSLVDTARLAPEAAQSSAGLEGAVAGPAQAFSGRAPRPRRGKSDRHAAQGPGELSPIPGAATTPVTSEVEGFVGFDGLNSVDSSVANGGDSRSDPPDQALCVGGGFVVVAVKYAVTVFGADGSGVPLLPEGPVASARPAAALNALFGVGPRLSSDPAHPPVFGPDLFDPTCHFDQDVRRFFLVVSGVDRDPRTGADSGTTALYVAVSATENPLGQWATFKLDTGQGDRFDSGCPCLDDFPHVGTDATGLFISANRYRVFVADDFEAFVNPKLHALSKRELARIAAGPDAAAATAVAVTVNPVDGESSFQVMPAITPPGAPFPADTEYFLSTPAVFESDDRVVVWALSNTGSLDSPNPTLELSHRVLQTLPYVDPLVFPTVQKPGPFPLGQSLNQPLGALDNATSSFFGVPYFADGLLWAALPTAVQLPGDEPHAGVLWMTIKPSLPNGHVAGQIVAQGYVAIDKDDLLYPSLAVNAAGRGAMVFSVAGPGRYPSAGYIEMVQDGPLGPVRLVADGTGPIDGVSCYVSDANLCRFGDYSAARVDEQGAIWMATEYSILAPRTPDTNWATFVGRLQIANP